MVFHQSQHPLAWESGTHGRHIPFPMVANSPNSYGLTLLKLKSVLMIQNFYLVNLLEATCNILINSRSIFTFSKFHGSVIEPIVNCSVTKDIDLGVLAIQGLFI